MREESSKERLDREFIELLNELRILLPGVQVLFAFLLTVPFSAGFLNASTFHRLLLLVALLATAVAIGLLVGYSSLLPRNTASCSAPRKSGACCGGPTSSLSAVCCCSPSR